MSFLELAEKRFSCRKFSDRPVEEDKLQQIVKAASLAPTAANRQPVKVWLLKSEEALAKVSETTAFTFGCKAVFAVGGKKEDGWVRKYDERPFADVDASIVAAHMMLAVEDLGLGTTWVGHFEVNRLKELFPEMAPYDMVALFPVGYPAEDAEPSQNHTLRKPLNELLEVL